MRVTGKARYNQRRSHPPQKFQIDGIRYTTSGKQNLCAIGSRHHLGCRSPRGETGIAANGLIQGTPLAVSKRTEEVCGRSSHGAMSPDKAAAGAKSSTCFYSEFGLGSLSCGDAAAHRTEVVVRPPERFVTFYGSLYCRGTDSDDSGRVGGGALRALLGRKAVFLIGFAALPIRGALYTLSDNPYYLVGVQLMDGIGAAIFGVLSVLVIADLTRGTGRFNFTQGVVATATGLGASLSNGITGFIVQRAGFNVAFLFLAVVAAFV